MLILVLIVKFTLKEKILKNMLPVESPCGIEPQSLADENLTIRP